MKRFAILGLRSLAAICFVLVVLGIQRRAPFAPPQYVLVLDDSPSVAGLFPGFTEKALRLWQDFPGEGHATIKAGSRPLPPDTVERNPPYTDLPATLRVAASLAPPGVETRILVVSDGVTREEGLAETLRLLRERGARVFALTPPEPVALARAVEIVAPERVFLLEPFTVRARIAATTAGPVEVRLARNGEFAAATVLTIDASGTGDVEFPQEVDRVGRVRYAVAVAGSSSPAVTGEVSVAQAPRVRWISGDPGAAAPLVAVLRNAGLAVEIAHPADLSFPDQDLARDEILVLDDVPAAALSAELVEALRRAVAGRGAGLVVLGGRTGLGSGEYADSPLESLLPAKAGYQSPPPPEAVSLVLALDTSFSMFYRGRGEPSFSGSSPRKIDVARESVKEVIRIVRPNDRLGIIGNSTDIFWIARLGEVTDRAAVLDAVDRVHPRGDGIYFYSMLHEAREALRGTPGGTRHVLVLCDADDVDQYEVAGRGHSFDLLRGMAQDGITVSILAIGLPTDKDVPFLRTAALLGRGDFYLVPRLFALPRYFTSEYRRLSTARHFLEEEALPVRSDEARPVAADEPLPPLSGFALVTPREGSRVLLHTNLGPPLLVIGEFGRGRTAVFAGDNGHRWAGRWLESASAQRFWLQLIFDAAPAGERERGFASLLDVDREQQRLRFRYSGKEAALPPWTEVWVLSADGEPGEALQLHRAGLRTFLGREPLPAEGYRRVIVAEDAGGTHPLLTTGFRIPPTEENLPSTPRLSTLQALFEGTGGSWISHPEEMRPHEVLARLPVPFPFLAIACGVLLLLAEVVVRNHWED